MTKPKITPGKRHYSLQPNGVTWSVWADDDTEVAECHTEADARSVTAEPDVLKALEEIAQMTEVYSEGQLSFGVLNTKAKTALIKAVVGQFEISPGTNIFELLLTNQTEGIISRCQTETTNQTPPKNMRTQNGSLTATATIGGKQYSSMCDDRNYPFAAWTYDTNGVTLRGWYKKWSDANRAWPDDASRGSETIIEKAV